MPLKDAQIPAIRATDKPIKKADGKDLIVRHYNGILASLAQPGSYEPLFDIDTRNDDILWEMWVEGFVQAMD